MHFLQKQSHYFSNDPRTYESIVQTTDYRLYTLTINAICEYWKLHTDTAQSLLLHSPFSSVTQSSPYAFVVMIADKKKNC